MTRKYILAIKVNSETGKTVEGNTNFETDQPLSQAVLEVAKERYCAFASENLNLGWCVADRAVILAVIPLEA